MSRKGWILFLSMGFIWGIPYLLIKVSVRELSAPMLVELRTAGGAVLLIPIALLRRELRPVLGRLKPVVAFALVEMSIPWLMLFNAERRLSSSLTGLLVAAVPLAGTVLARLTGKETKLDRRRLVGILLGLGGVAALVGLDLGKSDVLALLAMAVVVIGYALGPWILAHHMADLPSLGVIAVSLAISAVLYAPAAAFDAPKRPLSADVIASVAALTVVCTALAFVVFFALITEVGPVRSTVITYINPAVAVLLGVTVLGEHFGVGTGVGFVLIVAGCLLATRRDTEPVPPARRRRHLEEDGTRPVPALGSD